MHVLKKGLWLLFGTLLPLAHIHGQAVCEETGESMAWQVSSGDRDIHLFGSIHVGKADFYPLHPEIEQMVQDADYVVFEVDPETASDPSLMLEIQAGATLPPGQTLDNILSDETLERLHRALARFDVPADNFMRMQPWYLTLVLTALQLNQYGYQPQFGLERYLMERKPDDTPLLELESAREQISFLRELNAETYLEYTLRGFEENGESVEAMMRAWQCADKRALEDFLFEDFSTDEAVRADMARLREKLFFERNRDMTETIEGFITDGAGDYFIVIGAGHLLGEESVVDLLRRRGHEVVPVSLP